MLLTGRQPQRNGITNWTRGSRKDDEANPDGANLPTSEITLAEALKDAGYRTAMFGKWHLGAELGHGPTDQGFDQFFGHLGGFIDNYRHCFLHGRGFHDLYDNNTEVCHKGEEFPDMMTKRACAFIDANKDQPFFMYVAFNIPHYPEQPDEKFNDRYADMAMPRQSYARMISTTDDRMGRIVARLDALELTDRTIIVFMSDNGHSAEDGVRIRFDDHASGLPKGHYYLAHGGGGNTGKWRGHKGNFYEGGIRVPAVIRYPAAIPARQVRDQAITACDWMPTILDLCGVDPPAGVELDGASLLPIIRDNAPTHHQALHWAWQDRWAVREGEWKLLGQGSEPNELVNLAENQPERTNHLQAQPEIADRLRQLHNEWIKKATPQPQS